MKREGGFLIAKIHQLSGRIFSRMLKKYKIEEINPSQGRIMYVLWQNDGISIHELAKRTQLGKSTMTSMLDRLEKSGYLVREPLKDDRRKILIRRTEKDRALQDLYDQVSSEMTELTYENFTEEEIDLFENYLKRILNNLVYL